MNHNQLLHTLERDVKKHPNTIFIACHYANCTSDLKKLGDLFDKYPNLYTDIGGRFAKIAPIPRTAKVFMEKYNDRFLYGTAMGFDISMYRMTFRILESADEHFYEIDRFGYHWPLDGLHLSDKTLEKIYYKNAEKLFGI